MTRESTFSGLKNDLNDFESENFNTKQVIESDFNEWDLERAIVVNAIFNHNLYVESVSVDLFSSKTYKMFWGVMRDLNKEGIFWDHTIIYSKISEQNFDNPSDRELLLGHLEYELAGIISQSTGFLLKPQLQNFYFQRLKTIFKNKIIKKTFSDLGYAELAEQIPEKLKVDLFNEIISKNMSLCEYDDLSISNQALVENYKTMIENIENQKQTTGVLSQIGNLDTFFNGFQPSRLYILGARPSMGKSALCMNIAVNAAKHKSNIYFRALEENGESVSRRILAYLAHVDNENIQRGTVSYSELDRLKRVNQSIEMINDHIFIDDSKRESAENFCNRIEKSFKEKPYDLIIIDHLVEFTFSNENRAQAVGDAAKRIKQMAKTLKVPVLCATQLNRQVESRKDQRPMLSDLKESGGIEEAADAVIFLYRDRQNPTNDSLTELLIQKNRDGRCGIVYLKFLAKFMMFDSDEIPNQTAEAPEWGSKGHHPDFE